MNTIVETPFGDVLVDGAGTPSLVFGGSALTGSVLVLNASYEPLHRVSVRHALKMLVRQVAVIEEQDEGRTVGPFPFPKVLRLVKYVVTKWLYRGDPRCTKDAVRRRDKNICAYCGGHATTVDHLLPRSRGGKIEWMNSVAACQPCNRKKDNRTPEEAGMPLLFDPYVPLREVGHR